MWSVLFFFHQIIFVSIIIGLFSIQLIFFSNFLFCLFHVFVSSTIRMNLQCYSRNHNHSFVLLCFQYIYWFLSLRIIIGLRCEGYYFDSWISVPKEPKESKLWGKKYSEFIRVKSYDDTIQAKSDSDFCVKFSTI